MDVYKAYAPFRIYDTTAIVIKSLILPTIPKEESTMMPTHTYQRTRLPLVLFASNRVLDYLRNPELASGAILAHDSTKDVIGMFQAISYAGQHPTVRNVFAKEFGNMDWFCRLSPNELYQEIHVPKEQKVIYFRFDKFGFDVPFDDLAYRNNGFCREFGQNLVDVQTAFSHTMLSKGFFDLFQPDKVMQTPVIYCGTPLKELVDLLTTKSE